jgi:hypothetical protein
MTVKELIDQLEMMPDDMEVKFAYNYGDYWDSEVCGTIGYVDILEVKHSDYHRMDKLASDGERGQKQMVILHNL